MGRPLANISFAMMRRYIRSVQKVGVPMMHTARSFSYYRKIFYSNESVRAVIERLRGQRIVDIGCGYTPYASDSMFRACHDADIEFYGVDPVIGRNIEFGLKERILARSTGGGGDFSADAPGLSKALAASAQELSFEDESVDEILCSYLLFVWIEDEQLLAEILNEFLRVLRPGGTVKLFPLPEWRFMRFKNQELREVLTKFEIEQTFVHGHGDWRVTPSMLTEMSKRL